MAEMKTLNGHEIVDEKARLTRAVYYGSIAEMITDRTLKVGMTAVTKGYYKENDGGGATYRIRRERDGDVIDDGLLHSLSNKLVAEMILPDEIIIETFGAVGDKTTDDTARFEKALATGRPVRGTKGHAYHIVDLVLHNNKISNCEFWCKDLRGNDGIILKSFATLENCKFTNFRNAVKKPSDSETNFTVYSQIKGCLFQYNFNGLYFVMEGNDSINQLIVENCYFNKNGVGADEMKTPYTEDGGGYGAYISGNFCNVVFKGNVFEYNTHSGIALVNTITSYLVSADVTSNYFEGNKNSAIYLHLTYVKNSVHINGNYYSTTDVNGSYTYYINYISGCSCYEMRDVSLLTVFATAGGKSLLNDNKEVVLDNKMTSPYFTMDAIDPAKHYMSVTTWSNADGSESTGVMPGFRMVYTATLTRPINLLNSAATTVVEKFPESAVDENGKRVAVTRETTIPRGSSWFLNSNLNEGESIVIHYLGK